MQVMVEMGQRVVMAELLVLDQVARRERVEQVVLVAMAVAVAGLE